MKPTRSLLLLALCAGLSLSASAQEAPKPADAPKPANEEAKRPEGGGEKKDQPEHQDREHHRERQKDKPGPEMKPATYLGVATRSPSPDARAMAGLPEGFGLVVEEIMPDSPAKTAGLQRYDLLTMLNDQRLVNVDQLAALVRSFPKDTEVTLTLKRAAGEQKVTLKLAEKLMPDMAHHQPPHSHGPMFHFGNMDREKMENMGREIRERAEKFAGQMQEQMRERMQNFNQSRRGPQPPQNNSRNQPNEGFRRPSAEHPHSDQQRPKDGDHHRPEEGRKPDSREQPRRDSPKESST